MKLTCNVMTIGTWNVRTLKGIAKLRELNRELDRNLWNFVGIS